MQELIKDITQVFTFLIRQEINRRFTFPKGNLANKTVTACIEFLQDKFTDELSQERIVDYCVCQCYALTRYTEQRLRLWNLSHSFGKKALERFEKSKSGQKYYEDKWLASMKISRLTLLDLIRDRKSHPLLKFVYMEFEDSTKKRLVDTEARLIVCKRSTMLWTPFSPICQECEAGEKCKVILLKTNPELYRLRIEEFEKNKV